MINKLSLYVSSRSNNSGYFWLRGTVSGDNSVLILKFDMESRQYLSNILYVSLGSPYALTPKEDETSYLLVNRGGKSVIVKVRIKLLSTFLFFIKNHYYCFQNIILSLVQRYKWNCILCTSYYRNEDKYCNNGFKSKF